MYMELFDLAIDISSQLVHFWQVKKACRSVLPSISYRIQNDCQLNEYVLRLKTLFFYKQIQTDL